MLSCTVESLIYDVSNFHEYGDLSPLFWVGCQVAKSRDGKNNWVVGTGWQEGKSTCQPLSNAILLFGYPTPDGSCDTRHISSKKGDRRFPRQQQTILLSPQPTSAILNRGVEGEFEAPRSANCDTPSNSKSQGSPHPRCSPSLPSSLRCYVLKLRCKRWQTCTACYSRMNRMTTRVNHVVVAWCFCSIRHMVNDNHG